MTQKVNTTFHREIIDVLMQRRQVIDRLSFSAHNVAFFNGDPSAKIPFQDIRHRHGCDIRLQFKSERRQVRIPRGCIANVSCSTATNLKETEGTAFRDHRFEHLANKWLRETRRSGGQRPILISESELSLTAHVSRTQS